MICPSTVIVYSCHHSNCVIYRYYLCLTQHYIIMLNKSAIQVNRSTSLTDAEIARKIMKIQLAEATSLGHVSLWPVFQEYVTRVHELDQSAPEDTTNLPN